MKKLLFALVIFPLLCADCSVKHETLDESQVVELRESCEDSTEDEEEVIDKLAEVNELQNDLEQKISSFLEKYKNTSLYEGKAHDDFIMLLANNPELIHYNFDKFEKEYKCTEFRVETSNDGRLRFYQQVEGSLRCNYIVAIQYSSDNGVKFLSWDDDDPEDYSKFRSVVYDMQYVSDGKYVTESYNVIGMGVVLLCTNLFAIEDDKIKEYHLYSGYSNLIVPGMAAYKNGGMYNNIEGDGIIREGDFVFIPIEGKGENYYESTGLFKCYRISGTSTEMVGEVGNPEYHKSVQNYKSYALHFKTKGFRIHIDNMPDGTVRYASWKASQSPSEEPRIVIKNGCWSEYRNSYVFESGDYTYYVSYSSINNRYAGHREFENLFIDIYQGEKLVFHQEGITK